MKITALAVAALVAATGLSAAADAQTRTVVTTHREVHTRTGPDFGRHHTRRVCRVEQHGHHRVRTCRTVRY